MWNNGKKRAMATKKALEYNGDRFKQARAQ